jgi:hypothetical protein
VYLPARAIGQAIVNLLFVLPAICFLVIPSTARLIRAGRLKLGGIGLLVAIGWVALSLISWLWNLPSIVPPYPLPDVLKSTIAPVLIYGLPVPIAALLLFPRKRMA